MHAIWNNFSADERQYTSAWPSLPFRAALKNGPCNHVSSSDKRPKNALSWDLASLKAAKCERATGPQTNRGRIGKRSGSRQVESHVASEME